MFTDVNLFVARLSEVEKSKFRLATEDGLLHLLYASHRFEIDMNDTSAVKFIRKVKETLSKDFAERSADTRFGSSWKF